MAVAEALVDLVRTAERVTGVVHVAAGGAGDALLLPALEEDLKLLSWLGSFSFSLRESLFLRVLFVPLNVLSVWFRYDDAGLVLDHMLWKKKE